MDVYQFGILLLLVLAVSDLIVGVSNDAVNFLNSSIGSRVASRRIILAIASLGILAGVTFSSGMMEVARKGIFHPQFFTMPELMVIFLAVMLTDVILLDLFNTFGLPTSTTVSIVFELLGAAVMVSLIKIHQTGASYADVANYINTSKALAIVFGILLSVIVAFFSGAILQFISRLIFTFDFERRLRKYGAVWGGVALASITYFILIKGAKGASFISDETLTWIRGNTGLILMAAFVGSALFLQFLLSFTRVHILKVVVLVGTFAIAMAFAANDLVNFIGVPLAGLSAYVVASGSGDILGQSMDALQQPVRSNTLFLLIAGAVMVATLWISRKARGVSKTELSLGRQDEGYERFESTWISRIVVRIVGSVLSIGSHVFPEKMRLAVARRLDRGQFRAPPETDGIAPSFDLVRASVNLMVASMLISFATSMKLPLSTTYVTFMVSMGTSLSDQAWGRESAVYRVTGVLTVIGGWFFTAMMAFSVSFVFALAMFYGRAPAVVVITCLAVFLIVRTHLFHRKREQVEQAAEVFNLRKVKDAAAATEVTFEHAGILLREVSRVFGQTLEGLFENNRSKLREAKADQRNITRWSNIIAANTFKVMRLLEWEDVAHTQRYRRTISSLQEIAESVRDIVVRANFHVENHHAGPLEEQAAEMDRVRQEVQEILDRTSSALLKKETPDADGMMERSRRLKELLQEYDRAQIKRIQNNVSKTRLSILFYAYLSDSLKIVEYTTNLLTVFQSLLQPRTEPDDPGDAPRQSTPDTEKITG